MSTFRPLFFGALLLLGLGSVIWQVAPLAKQAVVQQSLNATFPGDVPAGAKAISIDRFSWESFVAANWPANSNGIIGHGGDHVAVWQFWKTKQDVLVPNGQVPIPWKQPSPIPSDCKQVAPPGTRILINDLKPDRQGDFVTPGSGPLIDQNGEYVRFEILVNESMYDFILSNQLYSVKGQKAYNPGGDVVFPSGVASGAVGAVMMKVAWKILGANDDPKRFHTAQAYLYSPNSSPRCQLRQVGMVGMHISHKTQNAPQWIWSTFEHVDNAPLQNSNSSGPFSFNDGATAHQATDCDDNGNCNLLPQGAWNPISGVKTPVQAARLTDFTATAKSMNAQYEAALLAVDKSSVFANYRLVGTQYPSDPNNVNDPVGVMLPLFLANTTMETFLQGDTTNVSSSCGGCHTEATMSDKRRSDFSYLLSRVGQ